jgi:hypothetical protein
MVKAQDLINEQKERERTKNKIYKQIYTRLEKKILQCNSMNLSECWYLLPEFFYNVPLYNRTGCKDYLKNKLKSDGFSVYFTGDGGNIIVVSWKS